MSSKFMGKLGKYANSVSRLFRGDDDDDAKQRDHEMLASALNETNALKEAFYRTPSKDRVRSPAVPVRITLGAAWEC